MTPLSINLSDNLAKASQKAAEQLGVSRTHFIRQAIVHELESFRTQLELEAIAKAIQEMKKSKAYLEESKEITEGFWSELPKDKDEWWKKKQKKHKKS